MLSPESRRRDFPSLEGRAYLNTAAEGIPPLAVGEALAQYFRDKQLGMDGRIPHAAQWEAAKALTAEFFGLSAEEIGICSCSSEAYNLAALALQLKPGDEVVVTDLDFPASSTPWLQSACPATTRVWKHRDGALRIEDLVPLLNAKTRFVNVSLVSFYSGFLVSLPPIIQAVRKNSHALFAVDVTQALGRIPLDLRGVDLIISSTHKWILASHGGGLVGVPKGRTAEWTDAGGRVVQPGRRVRPDELRERAEQAGRRELHGRHAELPGPVRDPRRAWSTSAGSGIANIDARTRPLVLHCLAELRKLPVEVLTPNEPEHVAGILAFKHPKAVGDQHPVARAKRSRHEPGRTTPRRDPRIQHRTRTWSTLLRELKSALVAV